MEPARLPSGSWKKFRVPTVGIVSFGITILPPSFSRADIGWDENGEGMGRSFFGESILPRRRSKVGVH